MSKYAHLSASHGGNISHEDTVFEHVDMDWKMDYLNSLYLVSEGSELLTTEETLLFCYCKIQGVMDYFDNTGLWLGHWMPGWDAASKV